MFRLAEYTSGNIYIDDININEISLHHLRKNLSIIPVNEFVKNIISDFKNNTKIIIIIARTYVIYRNNSI